MVSRNYAVSVEDPLGRDQIPRPPQSRSRSRDAPTSRKSAGLRCDDRGWFRAGPRPHSRESQSKVAAPASARRRERKIGLAGLLTRPRPPFFVALHCFPPSILV